MFYVMWRRDSVYHVGSQLLVRDDNDRGPSSGWPMAIPSVFIAELRILPSTVGGYGQLHRYIGRQPREVLKGDSKLNYKASEDSRVTSRLSVTRHALTTGRHVLSSNGMSDASLNLPIPFTRL